MEEDGYIPVADAQKILRVSARQVQRHAASGKIRSKTEGRRLMLLEEDVERLAEELGSEHRKEPAVAAELVPDSGDFMEYVRDLQAQLLVATRRVGELEGQLSMRLLPADEAVMREALAEERARAKLLAEENERLKAELSSAQKPWWQRLFSE